ncbi:MAG: DUF4157 domain-containing protein, partial [Anaerolineae bacterium]|nr:DUF4157 domain-containing protein [Anaerolineae bacterium]
MKESQLEQSRVFQGRVASNAKRIRPETQRANRLVQAYDPQMGSASVSHHATTLNRVRDENPESASEYLLQLQRDYGNQFVQHVIQRSREADADNIVPPEVEQSIDQARGGGQPLGSQARAQMEPHFGRNFSSVRIHNDARADTLSRALNARAFTIGRDIFFRQGAHDPGSSGGRELLAHELTHVVQQGSVQIRRELALSQPDDEYEEEANRAARAIVQREQGLAQRQEVEEEKEQIETKREKSRLPRQVEDEDNLAHEEATPGLLGPQVEDEVEEANLLQTKAETTIPIGALDRHKRTIPEIQRQSTTQTANPKAPSASKEQLDKASEYVRTFIATYERNQALIKRDVEEIREILLEHYIGDSDEKKILAKFEYWDIFDENKNKEIYKLMKNRLLPEWPPTLSRTLYLDKLIDECQQRTLRKGTFRTAGVSHYTNVYQDLRRELEDENEVRFRAYLQKSSAGRLDAAKQKVEFPNFWSDVVWVTIKGFPGGIVAGTGGVLKTLPLGETAGNMLVDLSKDYLLAVEYGDREMIESASGYSELTGELLGIGVQIVKGGGAALNKAGAAMMTAQFVKEVATWLPVIEKVFEIVRKTINDVAVEVLVKHESPNWIDKFLDRGQKEALSLLGEVVGKEAESTKVHTFKSSTDVARRSEGEAKKLKKRGRGRKQTQRQFDWKLQSAHSLARFHRRDARKALAAYVVRLLVRRLIVNLVHEVMTYLR